MFATLCLASVWHWKYFLTGWVAEHAGGINGHKCLSGILPNVPLLAPIKVAFREKYLLAFGITFCLCETSRLGNQAPGGTISGLLQSR